MHTHTHTHTQIWLPLRYFPLLLFLLKRATAHIHKYKLLFSRFFCFFFLLFYLLGDPHPNTSSKLVIISHCLSSIQAPDATFAQTHLQSIVCVSLRDGWACFTVRQRWWGKKKERGRDGDVDKQKKASPRRKQIARQALCLRVCDSEY